MNKKNYVNAFNKKWDDCLKQARKDIEENNGTLDEFHSEVIAWWAHFNKNHAE